MKYKCDFNELDKEIYLNHLKNSYQLEIDLNILQKKYEYKLIHNYKYDYIINVKFNELLKNKHLEYINLISTLLQKN